MNDFMQVLITKDALERVGIKEFELFIPYFPYARQDRICNYGESFTLKVFTKLINDYNFNKVIIFDPHSDVTPALLDNCEVLDNYEYVNDVVKHIKYHLGFNDKSLYLVSPDSGANKKVNKLGSYVNGINNIIKCDKKRDLVTGNLSGFEVFRDSLQENHCLIVDDICSKGGTFMGLAKELKNKNAGNIYLCVSHYENVAKEEELKKSGINKVFKTNSMNDYNSDFVINFNI